MEDIIRRREGMDYYDSLSEEQKKLVDSVFFATIDMCSQLVTESEGKPFPIFFYEDVAYKVFRGEMLGHMLADEMYNAKVNEWQKSDEFNPKY